MSDQVLSQEEVDALFLSMSKGKDDNMSPKKENVIQSLEKISEDIETLGINDESGWKNLCTSFEHEVSQLADTADEIEDLLALSAEALESISEKTAADSLQTIDALFDALAAIIEFLKQTPRALDNADEAVVALKNALETEEEKVFDADADTEDKGELEEATMIKVDDMTLDDIAALLIELEPENTEDLKRFRGLLKKIVSDEIYPDPCREQLHDAIDLIQDVIDLKAEDPDEALDLTGKLIENALILLEKEEIEPVVATADGSVAADIEAVAGKSGKHAPDGDGSQTEEPVEEEPFTESAMYEAEPEYERTETSVASGVKKPDAEEPAAVEESSVLRDEPEKDYMPDDAEPELLAAFVTESSELITNAEDALLALETDPEDMEAIGSVFRAFHTIKGTAAFLELSLIAEMGHHAESLLSRVRDGEIRYEGGYADLSLKTLDMLKELIMAVQSALSGGPLLRPAGYDSLLWILKNPEQSGVSAFGGDEEDLPLAKARVGDILVAQGKVQPGDVEKALSNESGEMIGTKLVQSKAASVTDVAHALRTQKKLDNTKKPVVDSSIRVPTERLDRFIDMVGELVVAHSMVVQDDIVASGKHHDLFKKVNHTSKIVRELQDMSMSMRMIPLKSTFRKMARLVRDLSRKIGKNVTFITEGDDTEIDRNMVDIINDPLVHMVRNALDHGIESPEVRETKGKPPYGTVKLSAYHSAGNVIVEIADDGKGIDKDAIVKRAVERGLISDAEQMSERDIYNLLFEPGFSTAEIVSDVSGRGVGMDVVKKNIENLRGQIEIQSTVGKGSVFRVGLPLTLAIIDGMVVRVGSEKYVIPTVSIIRSVRPEENDISSILNKGEMIAIQGKLIPLFRLGELFYIDDAENDPTSALVVVVENHMNQAGLLIDELIGSQQIVIKTLGESMGYIPGISGSAIMPNGRVGLILDVGEIVRLANSENGKKVKETL